jgi:hypothetical protein
MENDKTSDSSRSHGTDENVEKVRNLMHSDRRLCISQAYYVEKFSGYAKLCVGNVLNSDPKITVSTKTKFQLTRNTVLSNFWPKNLLLK